MGSTKFKLTDDEVIAMRKDARINRSHGASYYASRLPVSVSTAEKTLRGTAYSHLNIVAPPVRYPSVKLTDADVIELRRIANTGTRLDLEKIAQERDVTVESIERAVRGRSFGHLNAIAPPHVRSVAKPHAQENAKVMYLAGLSYKQISKILHISKSSISLWLRDVPKRKETRRPTGKGTSGPVLTDDDVLLIRKSIRAEGVFNLAIWAERFKVSKPAISYAARGITFKHLDEMEAPISGTLPRRSGRIPKPKPEKKVRDPKVVKPKGPPKRHKNHVLTVDMVVEMRRTVRATGYIDVKTHAQRYGVSEATALYAIRGKTFSRANEFEPPITEKLKPRPYQTKGTSRERPDEAIMSEAIALRRSDPDNWSWKALSEWIVQKGGKAYASHQVSRMLNNRDPSIKDVQPTKPPKVTREPKPRTPSVRVKKHYNNECVICETPFQSTNPHKELCGSKDCLDIVREANRWEASQK